MGIRGFLFKVHLLFLLPLAFLSSIYLYLYPVWHRCGFEGPTGSEIEGVGSATPFFRLLTLADPQIEGDSSLRRFTSSGSPEWKQRWKHRRERGDGDGNGNGNGNGGIFEKFEEFVGVVVDGREVVREVGKGVLQSMRLRLKWWQKKVDLWGNDLYLAHVYRTMRWWTGPTHTVVLGDLVGSQWIADEEFERRGRRFWDVVFRGGKKVTEEDIYRNEVHAKRVEGELERGNGSGNGKEKIARDGEERVENVDWTDKVINVVGNHDIGYAGDMTLPRLLRFESTFGPLNYMLTLHPPPPPPGYELPTTSPIDPTTNTIDPDELIPPVLRLLNLNSLALDLPIKHPSLSDDSYRGINLVLKNRTLSPLQATVLLTHLPLHKQEGLCADGPFVEYFPEWDGGGVREQNHLSDTMSAMLLGWLFALPTNTAEERRERGIVLTGHDHVGCDVWHYYRRFPDPPEDDEGKEEQDQGYPKPPRKWTAVNYANKDTMHAAMQRSGAFGPNSDYEFEGIREVTVRSMMGEFGGNAGLVSAWFDWKEREWRFKYTSCSLGVQHIWWAVHVIDIIAIITSIVLGAWHVASLISSSSSSSRGKSKAPVAQGKKEQ